MAELTTLAALQLAWARHCLTLHRANVEHQRLRPQAGWAVCETLQQALRVVARVEKEC